MRQPESNTPRKPTVRLGHVVLTGRKVELAPRKPTPEESEFLRSEGPAARRTSAPAVHHPQPTPPPEKEEWVKRRPGGRHGLPVTIRAGKKCMVPGFKPGDRVRLVDERESGCPWPQLTPADLQAIANVLKRRGIKAPDFSEHLSPEERAAVGEAERVWIGVLAALDRFPGSEVIQ